MELSNCPRCGILFAKAFRDLCPNCLKQIEQEYERCVAYLREERQATMQELSEATEVSVRQITRFIKEGRISIYQAPNLTYDCEICHKPIREGNMCEPCRNRLVKEFTQTVVGAEETKEAPRTGDGAYRVIDTKRERE
ncbi:flagellar protein [Paenibacillus alvei]|uniref:Flagellar protein n=1 Tax=Paenibacillus alvei TaxID=44250 RepID=A0AAP6ZYZ2_PAEAL|nr:MULTISPECIES: TIGR03826 family flagellar region protein [Paenibacillus]EJW18415.1 flagellar protein [Paenibacillus alvei DSM 29]MBG9735072.1 flagellar protein [Paenibacillus alvei]MBG9743530.1 flagellar protein [Paenibacillus alvei]MCY7485243.1 flagellar protein [Paenibacillus alvei]MCY9540279.1 flagellar protein [Paenibacillus alvei]